MAFLIAVFFLMNSCAARAENEHTLLAVLYDPGDPMKSVAILPDALLEAGSLYRNYRVISFEPDAVVLQEQVSGEHLKWVKEGEADENLVRRARNLFIVKQMKAVFEAQIAYLHHFGEGYAADLETLVRGGFLDDGFEDGRKQNYTFRIQQIRSEFSKEPSFLAVAEPLELEKKDYYFSVDQLGLVRYADTLVQASWGPVWEYGVPTAPLEKSLSVPDSNPQDPLN